MTTYYSKTTNGFFHTGVQTSMPSGLVEISEATYQDLLSEIQSGKILEADSSGNPVAVAVTVATPTLAQQAESALSSGLTITTTGSLILDSVNFPVDPATTQHITSVGAGVALLGGIIPGGGSTLPLVDTSGALHALTLSQYKTIVEAIMLYVMALREIIDTNNSIGATELPADSVTLALS